MNYKLYVSIQKVRKMQNLGNVLHVQVPFCYEQNWCAERTLQHLQNMAFTNLPYMENL
jgi:hypothetical protein